jgi:hypothetical protein
MNEWIKLVDYPDDYITRGAVLRVPSVKVFNGDWYADDIVDFLVFDASHFSGAYGLVVVSGYKAGCINIIFPTESSGSTFSIGLQKVWLINNWNKWVYIDGSVDSVWIKNPDSVNSMPDNSIYGRY